MKKYLSALLLLVLVLTLGLTGCRGQKAIENLEVHGLKTEYELNEEPDFKNVTATVIYNDGTSKNVTRDELDIGDINTKVAGTKDLIISYQGFAKTYQVTVKSKSVDVVTRELVSIEYFGGLPQKIFVNDKLNFDVLKIIANYSDGTEEVVDATTNSNIKHNGSEINSAVAGTQVLTISYMGKSVNVNLVVNEILLTDIEIDGDTVDTTIVEGTAFDPTGMVVYALYNNGARLPISLNDLTITQDGTKVSISYQGKTEVLTLSTEAPTILSMAVTATGYEENIIIVGDKIGTGNVKVTASLNNGTKKTIDNSNLSFNIPEITGAGTYTINVTYVLDESITASYEITVLGIQKIVIDSGTVNVQHPVDTPFSTTNVVVNITCTNGARVQRTISDGVVVDSSAVKADTINPYENGALVPYNITATYGGVTSEALGIYVYDPSSNVIIIAAQKPASLNGLDAKKEAFQNKDYGYFVGDDNPFIFKLDLTVVSTTGTPVTNYTSYTSHFDVYLNGVLLSGDQLNKYVDAIDAKNNSIDFSEAAIGLTFKINTRPANGVNPEDPNVNKDLEVTIVDGTNIYEAYELNYLTNFNYDAIPNQTRTQTQIAEDFLATKGKTRPTGLTGIVVHNDLNIQRTDIPAELFVDGNRSNDVWDIMSIFSHTNDSPTGVFSFYGNYFTIYTYNLPIVKDGNGIQSDMDTVSNGQVFRFSAPTPNGINHNYKDYTTNLNSIRFRDDDGTNDNIMTSGRDKLGLICMKVDNQLVNVENMNIEAYYISFFIDNDYTVVNMNECTLFNSWQNHIFIWSTNELSKYELDSFPTENFVPATLNITNSKVTKCGGPVIIAQTKLADYNCGTESGAQVSIDDKTEIWTWVTGTEAWFTSMGVQPIALELSKLGRFMASQPDYFGGKTFIRTTNEAGQTHGEYVFMNMVMVNLVAGIDPTAMFTSTTNIDGKITIAGKTYLDMTDSEYGNYADPTVSANLALLGVVARGGSIINTCDGGALLLDANNNLAGTANPQNLSHGDYITLYKGNIGIVFGYQVFQ